MDDSYTNDFGVTVTAGDLVVLEVNVNPDRAPHYKVGRVWSVTPYEVRLAYKKGHAVDDNWWPLGAVVHAFSLDELFPTAPEGSTEVAFNVLSDKEFSGAEHAKLIMNDFDAQRRGPVVEISVDDFGTVALKMFWSAATIVMFALQPLRLSMRLQDPTLDADGNLVMLLSRFDRTPVDATAVRSQLHEMGFQVGDVDTPPPF